MAEFLDNYGVGYTVDDVAQDLFNETDENLRQLYSRVAMGWDDTFTSVQNNLIVKGQRIRAIGTEKHFNIPQQQIATNIEVLTSQPDRYAQIPLVTMTFLYDGKEGSFFKPVAITAARGYERTYDDFAIVAMSECTPIHVAVRGDGIKAYGQLVSDVDCIGTSDLDPEAPLGSLEDADLNRLRTVTSAITSRVACVRLIADGADPLEAMQIAGMLVQPMQQA